MVCKLAIINGGATWNWADVVSSSVVRNDTLVSMGLLVLEESLSCLVSSMIEMLWSVCLHWGVACLLELRVIQRSLVHTLVDD